MEASNPIVLHAAFQTKNYEIINDDKNGCMIKLNKYFCPGSYKNAELNKEQLDYLYNINCQLLLCDDMDLPLLVNS